MESIKNVTKYVVAFRTKFPFSVNEKLGNPMGRDAQSSNSPVSVSSPMLSYGAENKISRKGLDSGFVLSNFGIVRRIHSTC